ncbi:hypothetical protein QEN19_002686 [Hanseniaspora menglaensis]
MEININKVIISIIYLNVFVFIITFVFPMVSISVTRKLFYEIGDKLVHGADNQKDLLIQNIYEQTENIPNENLFSINLSRLPVDNFQYTLPQLDLFFVCDVKDDFETQNVNFVEIIEYLDNDIVRTSRRNVYCSEEKFDYFTEVNTINNNLYSSWWAQLFSGQINEDITEFERLAKFKNLNKVIINKPVLKDTLLVRNSNKNYIIEYKTANSAMKLLANSKIHFKYDVNDEIFVRKIIMKHSVLVKLITFINIYNFMIVSVLASILLIQRLLF